MAQIGVQSTLVLVSSESGFEGCDLDEMSSVEYLCSGTSAVEDRLLSQGCQAEPDSMASFQRDIVRCDKEIWRQ